MALILVIDDDPGVREVLRAVLEAEGYDVRTAADGRTGLAAATDTPPDLVILDFRMPGLSGAPVLQALKTLRPSLPVFYHTVYGDLPGKTALDEADCCFLKSADLKPLLDAVERTLGPVRSVPPCPVRLQGLRDRADQLRDSAPVPPRRR